MLYERPDEKLLEKFYANPRANAFHFQVDILCRRLKGARAALLGKPDVVLWDRSHMEDRIFADMHYALGNISDSQYETYLSLFDTACHVMGKPDAVVFLEVKPATSMSRMRARLKKSAGKAERGVSMEYLEELCLRYRKFRDECLTEFGNRMVIVEYDELKPVERVERRILDAIAGGPFQK